MRNQKNKSLSCAIACLLVMILVITSLPGTVLAITVESSETVTVNGEEYVPQIFEWESEEMIYAVNEIVSLREENVKHFSLPNGTYRAVAYDSAVHRLDENGKWQDIDNSLTAATEKGKPVLKTSDGRITVPATFTASEPVLSLWEDGIGIAMYFVSGRTASVEANHHLTASASAASVQNAPKRALGFDTVEEAIAVDNKTSVTYEDVLPETDLQYELRGNDVKENIIIGAPSALYEYTFLLRLSALTATLEEDGSISLREETGRERAVIPAPFMYDAAGNRSLDVSYTLEAGGNGLYALTLSADAAWINAEGRAFPVTVDPYIDWSEDNAYAADTYISSTDPDENFGLEEDVKISANDIALLQVELPYIPDGSMVNSANLVIQYYGTSSQGASSGTTSVSIYQMLESWYELDVTWNEVAEWDDFGMEAEPVSTVTLSTEVGTTSANRATANIPIKSVAKDWYGYSENYGVAIKYNFGDMNTLYFTAFEGGEGYAYISVEYVYYIPDGIYALKKAGWMAVSGTSVIRENLATPPHENFYRSGLFKITRVTPDGVAAARYVIRSMWDNNYGISVSGTTPVVKELPSRDSEVSSSDTFYIDWHISGFHIRAYNGNVVLAAPSATSGETGNLITLPGDTASTAARWALYAYTDAPHRAYIQIYIPYSWDSKGAIVGTTYSVPYYVHWSTYVGADTFRLRVMPQSEEIASYTWEEDTKTFTVTPLSPGTMELRAEILYGDSATEEVAFRQSFSEKVIPKEGTYYFQNAWTERYMDVEGPSTASGAAIHEWNLHTATQEKWIVEHVAGSGGYVRIKSAYSNLYLGISSTNSSYVGQYSTLNNYTLWRFERTPSGNLQLICAATDTSDLVLSVPTTASPSSNGANLTQYDKDNTFTLDEWEMHKFHDISLIAIVNVAEEADRSEYFDDTVAVVATIGYTDAYTNQAVSEQFVTKEELLELMRFSRIVLIRTHGYPTSITLSDDPTSTADDYFFRIGDLPVSSQDPNNDLKLCELVLYGACSTAQGGETANNLVTATAAAGARTVIGFNQIVDGPQCNDWCRDFFRVYADYYGDSTKTFEAVVTEVNRLSNLPPDQKEEEGAEPFMIAEYVICGAQTLPS